MSAKLEQYNIAMNKDIVDVGAPTIATIPPKVLKLRQHSIGINQ